MKRIVPLALALILLCACSASGTDSAGSMASPTPLAELTASPQPTTEVPKSERLSPYAEYANDEQLHWRTLDYVNNPDESQIEHTLEFFLRIRYDQIMEYEYADFDFSSFLDGNSEHYEDLLYFVDEARSIKLMNRLDDEAKPLWYSYNVDIESVEVEGDDASATVWAYMDTLYPDESGESYSFMSIGSSIYYIDLHKVDGLWHLSGIMPKSQYPGDGDYEELQEYIETLEAELETKSP